MPKRLLPSLLLLLLIGGLERMPASDAPLRIGWAEIDITPEAPVAMVGQHYQRIADPAQARDRLTATAMAIEGPDGSQAVLVSLDLVGAYDLGLHLPPFLEGQAEGLDRERILLFATHTHTGPYLSDKQGIPAGTATGTEYRAFLYPRLAAIIAQAWDARAPAQIGAARSSAPIGFCRIATYADGSAKMYGTTDKADFAGLEGPHDHDVELLYSWNAEGGLSGVVVNLACPSQALEHRKVLSADFWSAVRTQLRAHPDIGDEVSILPMCGAAGDQSPRDLTRPDTYADAEALVERIGTDLTAAVLAGLPAAERARSATPIVRHAIERFTLPRKPGRTKTHPFPVTLHAIRLGDIAIVDNPFELYLQYGLDIERRARAATDDQLEQVFIAQLASGPEYGMYLATEQAIPGGAYGSRLKNGQVPPEGGAILVDKTVALIAELFGDEAAQATAPAATSAADQAH